MNIKITGCNNCPFAAELSCDLAYRKLGELVDTSNENVDGLREDIPHNCPIKATESKSITISI